MGGAPWKTTFFSAYLVIYTSVDHGGFCQSAIEGREARGAELMSEPLCKGSDCIVSTVTKFPSKSTLRKNVDSGKDTCRVLISQTRKSGEQVGSFLLSEPIFS